MEKPKAKYTAEQIQRLNQLHNLAKAMGLFQRGESLRWSDETNSFRIKNEKQTLIADVPKIAFIGALDSLLKRRRWSGSELLSKENKAIFGEPEFAALLSRFNVHAVKEARKKAKEKPPTKLRTGTPESKKNLVPKLPHDWRESMWTLQSEISAKQSGKNKGTIQTALAVATATGLRPEELAKGVELIRLKNGGVGVVIKGAKFSRGAGHDRGIESRTIGLDMSKPWSKYLAQQMDSGIHQFSYNKNLFRKKVRELGHRYLAQVKRKALDGATISPYAFRHAMGSDLKSSAMSAVQQSQVMGHLSTKSLQKYGKKRRGSGNEPAPVSLIKASSTPTEKPAARLSAVLRPPAPAHTR